VRVWRPNLRSTSFDPAELARDESDLAGPAFRDADDGPATVSPASDPVLHIAFGSGPTV